VGGLVVCSFRLGLLTRTQMHRDRLARAGRPHLFLRLPWATHGCDVNFSEPCGQISTYAIERFLAAVLP